jgi:hypothetical protein
VLLREPWLSSERYCKLEGGVERENKGSNSSEIKGSVLPSNPDVSPRIALTKFVVDVSFVFVCVAVLLFFIMAVVVVVVAVLRRLDRNEDISGSF